MVIGRDGTIEQASAVAESLLAPEAGLVGRAWEKAAPPSAIGAVLYGAVQQCRTGETVIDCSGPLEVADGQSRWVEWRVYPLNPDEAEPPRVLIWGTDVTRRHELECQLQRVRDCAVLGQLFSGVAHELRNPLTTILGLAELLEDRISVPELCPLIAQLRTQAERARQIVARALSIARPADNPDETCDVNQVVADAVQFLRYQLELAGCVVVQSLAPDLPPVRASAHEVGQVIINLISNAMHAITAAGKGQIEIATRHDGGRVCVSVTDDGPGFAPDILPRAFEPFTTTKPPQQGAGLGLCIARGIVEKYGGTIRAANRPGGGAQVVIDLPALTRPQCPAPPPEPAGSPTQGAAPAVSLRGRRVLVIDDEEPLRVLLEEALGMAGHHVDVANDGEAALAKVRGEPYDLIICDLRMPGMSGEEFYAALEDVAPQLQRKIVFSTGDTSGARCADFLSRTGLPVLEKPFSIRKVLELVASLT
jgi:signal transduction histidine kinase